MESLGIRHVRIGARHSRRWHAAGCRHAAIVSAILPAKLLHLHHLGCARSSSQAGTQGTRHADVKDILQLAIQVPSSVAGDAVHLPPHLHAHIRVGLAHLVARVLKPRSELLPNVCRAPQEVAKHAHASQHGEEETSEGEG